MARGYYKCATCGESVVVYGRNRREADSRTAWHESRGSLCTECERAEFDKQNAEAAESNAAAGLPPLTGSNKQIAWAETIRAAKLQTIADAIAGRLDHMTLIGWFGDVDPLDPGVAATVPALQAQTSASWWIDRRDRKAVALLEEIASHMPAPTAAPDPDLARLEAEAIAETTIRPPNEKSSTVADIRVIGDKIEIHYPEKREDFRQVVRFELCYAWSGTAWGRAITARSGPVADRVAEAGNCLLAAGFPIRIQDADLRRRAVEAHFEPERTRWISVLASGEYVGRLYITWPREDDLYDEARSLPGARYLKPGIAVPVSASDAVEDFAEAHGFSFTERAMEAMEAGRMAHDAALVATPAKAPERVYDEMEEMQVATGEIDPELLDD